MIDKRFRVDILGDLELSDLVADIYVDDQILAVLSQEEGFENMRISIYPPENKEFWNFSVKELEEVIAYAKKRLWELRRNPETNSYC